MTTYSMCGYVWFKTLSMVRRRKRPWLYEGVTMDTSGQVGETSGGEERENFTIHRQPFQELAIRASEKEVVDDVAINAHIRPAAPLRLHGAIGKRRQAVAFGTRRFPCHYPS